jgi:Tol biopolymer transport system component
LSHPALARHSGLGHASRHAGRCAVRSELVLGFGRALRVGLVGLPAALIALSLADPRLGAEPESRGEGRIAFTFGESGDRHPSQLAVMDGDGRNRRLLPLDHVYGLSWSPDGRLIAFQVVGLSARPNIYRPNIWTMNVDRRPRYRRVVRNGGSPDWSPNGRSIAFERGGDIWVFDLGDRRQRRIVRDGSSPSWSPDGRKLAFERARGQRCLPQACVSRAAVWVLEIAAKKERRLVRNGDAANWSPDGRQIAFERWRSHFQDFESFIYVMRADGTAQRRLFRGEHPVWSPNGQELAFVGRDDGRYADAIIRARLDGRGRRVLFGRMPYCGCVAPEWGPPPRRGRR